MQKHNQFNHYFWYYTLKYDAVGGIHMLEQVNCSDNLKCNHFYGGFKRLSCFFGQQGTKITVGGCSRRYGGSRHARVASVRRHGGKCACAMDDRSAAADGLPSETGKHRLLSPRASGSCPTKPYWNGSVEMESAPRGIVLHLSSGSHSPAVTTPTTDERPAYLPSTLAGV